MAKKKRKKVKNKGKKFSFKQFIVLISVAVSLVMFLATSVILLIGMLPTMVAFVIDRHPSKNKTFTIGAMNFAGCFPYLLEVWLYSNSMEVALRILSDPKTIIVMYSAAAVGYGVNMIVTYTVSAILLQKADIRVKRIEKEKMALEERWGSTVNSDPYAEKGNKKPNKEEEVPV